MPFLTALLTGLVAPAAAAAPPAAPSPIEPSHAPKGYGLVFSDEFNTGTVPDPAKWRFDVHRNAQGWYNQEKQYYAKDRPENARIEKGHLVIEARAETLGRAQYPDHGGQKYTSARMITQGLGDWTYGFYEFRARYSCGRGTWPAIWMLPSDPAVQWPDGGEIDIMEHVGYDPTVVHQTLITKAFNFKSGVEKTTAFTIPDACTTMHRYQLLWTPDFVVLGVDDTAKFMLKKTTADRARWPYDKPMHILLNVAVGGEWGGQKGIDPAAFPARLEVDYVRVYQKQPAAAANSKGN